MKILKVVVVFIFQMFPLFMNAQSLREEFKSLAEYTILKEQLLSIEDSSDWISYPSDRINICTDILSEFKQGKSNFDIQEIFKISKYRFITIQDLSVRGLVPNIRHIFAITEEVPGFLVYKPVDKEIGSFVNNYIYKISPSLDKMKIIDLYNVLKSTLAGAIFFDGTNEKEFSILSDNLKQYRHAHNVGGSYWLENVFKVKQLGLASYYHVLYRFDCSSFTVETTLFYQLKE